MDVGIAIGFWILASLAVISSAAVVLLRDLFRASLFLVLSFLSVAGIYIVLQADFLAVAQVLIYVGAISILLIFAIMLTRDTQRGNPSNKLSVPGAFLAGSYSLRSSWLSLRRIGHCLRSPRPTPRRNCWRRSCSTSSSCHSKWRRCCYWQR